MLSTSPTILLVILTAASAKAIRLVDNTRRRCLRRVLPEFYEYGTGTLIWRLLYVCMYVCMYACIHVFLCRSCMNKIATMNVYQCMSCIRIMLLYCKAILLLPARRIDQTPQRASHLPVYTRKKYLHINNQILLSADQVEGVGKHCSCMCIAS